MIECGGMKAEVINSKKKRKRKLKEIAAEENLRPCKTPNDPVDSPAEEFGDDDRGVEMGQIHPWGNLNLILSLKNKHLDAQKKLELAFDFVKGKGECGMRDDGRYHETVKMSRLIVFLHGWIRSLLFGKKSGQDVVPEYLDRRSWEIFRFCLEKASALSIALNASGNVLQPICSVARHLMLRLEGVSTVMKEAILNEEEYELYGVVSDCTSLMFSSHECMSNENLELWISTVDVVVKLVNKVIHEKLEEENDGVLVLRFSCLVLKPFAKILRIHPLRKGGFSEFVDKLLEPLLEFLGVMHLRRNVCNKMLLSDLLEIVEEVLSSGLFHPSHIDGFLTLHSTDKYLSRPVGKTKASTTVIKSYHRHLFDRLERIVDSKKFMASNGMGDLFRLLADKVKKQVTKAMPLESGKESISTKDSKQQEVQAKTEKSYGLVSLVPEIRKALFDFFVQITEPLLLKLNRHLGNEMERENLEEFHSELNCLRRILFTFTCEKVYFKTEDISGGACLGFMKKVYDTLISLSIRINQDWSSGHNSLVRPEVVNSPALAESVIASLGCLLEIEYEVVGGDIITLWSIIISFLAFGISLNESIHRSLLLKGVVNLGCQLVTLYSELRQVDGMTFALCRALRVLRLSGAGESSHAVAPGCNFSTFAYYAKAVGSLLYSQEFKLALCNAILSIPEGQASGCIRQLAVDVSETLMWLKLEHSEDEGEQSDKQNGGRHAMLLINLKYEVLGRGLSEIYGLVLGSLTVTRSNSTLVGSTMKGLMAVIRPHFNSLLGSQGINEFLLSLTSSSLHENLGTNHEMCTHWAFVFLFSLYMSCRSLIRQIISLMPPDSAKKMSSWIGDLLTANAGIELIERTDWTDEGYFSWMVNPSASLLDVIQSISDVCRQSDVVDCSCLIYQLHAMALQRLVDLNRKINSAEYLLQNTDLKLQSQELDVAVQSVHKKGHRKWKKSISKLKTEAAGLTEFLIRFLLELVDKPSFTTDGVGSNSESPHESDKWDLSFSSMNKQSLPVALWWIVCRNIDVWCCHASKKWFKMFLSLLIQSSLSFTTEGLSEVHHKNMTQPPEVTVQYISFELLNDSTLYERRFVRRHLASSFCKILENSARILLPHSTSPKLDLYASSNWAEILEALEKSLENLNRKQSVNQVKGPASSFQLSMNDPSEGVSCVTSNKLSSCQKMLRFLCWVPKGFLNSKSLKLYVASILYTERLAVSSMLSYQADSKSRDYYQLLRLFLCCRKALKNLLDTSCSDNAGAEIFSFSPVSSEGSLPFQWLFKSAYLVLGIRDTLANGGSGLYLDAALSLMDHTSYIFLVSSKRYFARTQTDSDEKDAQCNSIPLNACGDLSENLEACECMFVISESIKKEIQGLVGSCEGLDSSRVNLGHKYLYLSKLAYLASCLSGFLWGLTLAFSHIHLEGGNKEVKILKRKVNLHSRLNAFLEAYTDLVQVQLCLLLNYGEKMVDCEKFSISNDKSEKDVCERGRQAKGVIKTCLESPGFVFNYSIADDIYSDGSEIGSGVSIPSCAAEAQPINLQNLNKSLLRRIMNGNDCEAALLLRHLLIGYSALLRLNLQVGVGCLSSDVLHVFMEVAQFLILNLENAFEVPESFIFVSLDGLLKFFEELGSHFPSTDPMLSRNAYTRIIELHLMAIGKCISFQGKKYKLISHEMESRAKVFQNLHASHSSYYLDEFKARLRTSFEVYIRRSSELHLLSAVQAVERALIGISAGSTSNYDINTGKAGGGALSSYAAAGIDCLDLLLENAIGNKRLKVVQRHIQSLIASLFNVIAHLQGPFIFCKRSIDSSNNTEPDSGTVILMCIEVLTRVSGRPALFKMDSWHLSQSVQIPTALFREFSQLWFRRVPAASALISSLPNRGSNIEENIDYQFSVDMYAACCRLLYTVLKHHHKRERKFQDVPLFQYVAQFQESVSVLLNVLETVNRDSVSRKNCSSWEIQEGVKCACSLRRIYEEMRQQKNVFGPHCFKFLASYISVYSGFGPLKSGIIREIDEALRPGIYALIDACSADDLQYLHTVFGEGPCRSMLARLQHDYTLNFQYEGKV